MSSQKSISEQILFIERPKDDGSKKKQPRHIIITLPKIKDKERILKASREKETVTYK